MLTGLVFLAGMFTAFAIGAAVSDYTRVGNLIDQFTRNLPMNWVWSEYED